ncbi:glycoside hydrolase 15 protein [Cryptotrichosporon argae]
MRVLRALVLASLVALGTASCLAVLLPPYGPGAVRSPRKSPGIDDIARLGILRNAGPAAGARDGVIVASPSRGERADEPDYYVRLVIAASLVRIGLISTAEQQYTWTRDAALTLSALLPSFLPEDYLVPYVPHNATPADVDTTLEPFVRAFVGAQADLQVVKTRSGELSTGGLNEPKFSVDGTAFNGEWGRPQRDGPALRALALIPYAHYLLDRGFPADVKYVEEVLYRRGQWEARSVIRNDLDEVARGWRWPGFDLWEEAYGHHLFTLLACLRALQAGQILAARLGDHDTARRYRHEAEAVEADLPHFFDADGGYWRASLPARPGSRDDASGGEPLTLKRQDEARLADETGSHDKQAPLHRDRTGKDCAAALATIHLGASVPPGPGAPQLLWPGASDVLSTLRVYVLSFKGLYAINERDWTRGWAVGRYAEDVYDGVGQSEGNPWFICTYAVAEALYSAQSALVSAGEIVIDDLSAPFWSDVVRRAARPGVRWERGRTACARAIGQLGARVPLVRRWFPFDDAVRRLGDVAAAYVRVGETRAVRGTMSEQMSRHDGGPTGARDLTWSYAAYLTVSRARAAARHRLLLCAGVTGRLRAWRTQWRAVRVVAGER